MKTLRMLCLLLLAGWHVCSYAAKVYERAVEYSSIDQYGDTILLSGKISVPENTQAKGLILLLHYTVGANAEVPSQHTLYEARVFHEDYVLVMPDYIGYGSTIDRFPPYLHGELTAHNCVDMLLGTHALLTQMLDSLGTSLPSDSILIVGFSQGGATALWTLKYIEEHYAEQIKVKRCFAGGGPYDVASTYDDALATGQVGMPLVVPLLVMGTNEAYGLQLNTDNFFTPAMKHFYNRHMADKERGVVSLVMLSPQHRLDYWLTEFAMDKSQAETRLMYEGLLRSSFVHYPLHERACGDVICPEWRPQTPLYIFHSYKDDVVPFVNAIHLQRCIPSSSSITYDFGSYGGHLRSLFVFLKSVKKQVD